MRNIVNQNEVIIPSNNEQVTPPLEPPPAAVQQPPPPELPPPQPQPESQVPVQEQGGKNFQDTASYIPPFVAPGITLTPPNLLNNPRIQQVFRDTSMSRERQYNQFLAPINERIENRGTRFVDTPNVFPNPSPPLLTRDIGNQLQRQEQSYANSRSRARGWSTLDWEFSDYGNKPNVYRPLQPLPTGSTGNYGQITEGLIPPNSPYSTFLETGRLSSYYTPGTYNPPIEPNEILGNLQRNRAPNYESASFPGANINGLQPGNTIDSLQPAIGNNQGTPSSDGNWLTRFGADWWNRSVTQVKTVGSVVNDVWNLAVGGEGNVSQRNSFERVMNGEITTQNLMGMFPRTLQTITPALENSAPIQTATGGYEFNPLEGKFGESGRGWFGATVYALSVPENIIWAGVYGAADLSKALAGDAGENIPIIRNIPDNGEPRGIFYRIGEALSGTDLSLLNERSDDKYLSLIDPNLSLQENLPWAGLAFAASFVVGGWADNAVGALRRGATLTRTATMGAVPELVEGAARTVNIETFGMTSDELFTPNIVRTLGDEPTLNLPVPMVSRRSNEEIAAIAQVNGDIPLGTNVSNEDVRLLQQLPNGADYSRYGESFDLLTDPTAPLPYRDIDLDTMDAVRQQIIQSPNYEETPDLIRQAIREYDSTLYTEPATAQWLTSRAPDNLTPSIIREVDNPVQDKAFQLAQDYLKQTDNLTDAGRGLQELEQQIELTRWEILRQSKRLRPDGDLGLLARGNITNEIATRLNLNEVADPSTVIREPYAPIAVSGSVKKGLYHGTRQVDLPGLDYREGGAHEYGVGLYLTNDVNQARLASKASRVQNNPLPGTTRLGPSVVYEINPQEGVTLNLSNVRTAHLDVMGIIYDEAKRVFNLDRVDINHESSDLRSAWLDVRSSYVKKRNAPVPEIKYKEFSNNVARRLTTELGINYLEDARRGVVVALPRNEFGQVPMMPRVVDALTQRTPKESFYARQKLDAELMQNLKHSVTEAWERQSRVAYENSLMNDLVRTYNKERRAQDQLLNQSIQSRRALQRYTQQTDKELLDDLQNPIQEPDEIKPYMEVDLDEPCL